jgi:predicted extracellular nuclease
LTCIEEIQMTLSNSTRSALWARTKTISALLCLASALSACGGSDTSGPIVDDFGFKALPACPAAPSTLTDISVVQGNGAKSPLENNVITVRGVVTGDFQSIKDGDTRLGGFFIQQATPSGLPIPQTASSFTRRQAMRRQVMQHQLNQASKPATMSKSVARSPNSKQHQLPPTQVH